MEVRYLAHASFLIVSDDGTRIITDPYKIESGIKYTPINETADIVTISHDHFDHNNPASVKGKPDVIKGAGIRKLQDIEIKGVATYHDQTGGSKRGTNTIFSYVVDGIKL